MTNARKIMITTESREVFIMRVNGNSSVRGFCSKCEAEVELLTLDQAVSISDIRTSDLMRGIEAKKIHGIETDFGQMLICSESLAENTVEKETGNEEL